jgi:hypothetical protein
MERLHETHGRTARPIKAAGGGGLEVERQVAEGDGPEAAIGKYADARRDGIRESKVIGSGETIDHHPNLALAGQRVDHIARIGIVGLSGEPVVLGGVVEAACDPPQASGGNQPVAVRGPRSAKSSGVQTRGFAGAEMRLRMAAGMLNARVDIGCLMSDKCSNLLTFSSIAICQNNATIFLLYFRPAFPSVTVS